MRHQTTCPHPPYLLARDGHVWAHFSHTQHVRTWAVIDGNVNKVSATGDVTG